MSELITVARPYAKAIFNFAVEQQKVDHWQSMLTFLVEVSSHKKMSYVLSSVFTPKKLADKFIAVCGDQIDIFGKNLIRIMAENSRLTLFPYILKQFVFLRAKQNAIVEVDVIFASPLKEEQLTKIVVAIEQRLSCKVKLNCKLDKFIISGVIIHVNGMVIDGSVRNRLERLADVLQS